MNAWVTLYRIGLIALVILLAVAVICIFAPKCRRLSLMQTQKIESQREIQNNKNQINNLREKQERFNSDPSYVERVAHEIGLIKPGETEYKFTNRPPASATPPKTTGNTAQ